MFYERRDFLLRAICKSTSSDNALHRITNTSITLLSKAHNLVWGLLMSDNEKSVDKDTILGGFLSNCFVCCTIWHFVLYLS